MKKAAFYLLEDTLDKARYMYACRLAEKAYQNHCTVYIFTASAEENEMLDIQLWTFRDISFVPHKIYVPEQTQIHAPILISTFEPPSTHSDVLINLTSTIPDFCDKFSHIIEVVPNDTNWRAIARKHYKQYQQKNYEVVTYDLSQK